MEGYNFSEFPKVAIQKFLKYAQQELPHTKSEAKREILCHVIRGAAAELKYRWRHNLT
jgi:hypothetical protein